METDRSSEWIERTPPSQIYADPVWRAARERELEKVGAECGLKLTLLDGGQVRIEPRRGVLRSPTVKDTRRGLKIPPASP
jgi:hypothetical protein